MTRNERAGFTLIELMIVVAILGVLAAIGIPSLVQYVRRAKAAEAYEDIKQIFVQTATYYARPRSESGLAGGELTACTVPSASNEVTPSADKQPGDYSAPGFRALGFSTVLSYYRYELDNQADPVGRCGLMPDTNPIYVIRGRGNLDADDVSSLFEMATGSNADNELIHARSFFVENETE